MFDDAGLKQATAGSVPCPGCTAPLVPGAVVCLQCGYNVKLGRKMGTISLDSPGGAGGGHGHGSAAAALLAKAEVAIQEDIEYEASKGKEGMPWWGYLLMLMGLMAFTVLMLTLPTATAMNTAGWAIIVLCLLTQLYLNIRLLIIAFEENITQGLLCLLVPFYQLYFIIMHWDKCGGIFIRSVMLGVAIQLGLAMLYISRLPPGVE